MKTYSIKPLVVSGLILLIIGFGGYASAGTYNHINDRYNMMDGHQPMGEPMGRNNAMVDTPSYTGQCDWSDLSADDHKKAKEVVDRFYTSTKDLKEVYHQKQIDLRKAHDLHRGKFGARAKINRLERDLSVLSSQLEKNRLDYSAALRKIGVDDSCI
jgi:hypothetical protein